MSVTIPLLGLAFQAGSFRRMPVFLSTGLAGMFLSNPGGIAYADRGSLAPCSEDWNRQVDERVVTGDGAGHGPDFGSDEWKSVVEFKLGIRGNADVPARESDDWCEHIHGLVFGDGPAEGGEGPSYSCDGVEEGSTEALICNDTELSALDRELGAVYAQAREAAAHEQPPVLKAEQRGWIKGRNECWKADDERDCVRGNYVHRIAELQAMYRLVDGTGPVFYACDDYPATEVVVTFFETDPPTLIAERGDSVSLMFIQPSGSGSRYRGQNETFWEAHGEATITWGYDAPEMRCKPTS